jgi:lipid A 4'-phosphatase
MAFGRRLSGMRYLKLRRSRIIIASFIAFALLMLAIPGIDLGISGIFFDGNTFPRDRWWQRLQQVGLTAFLCLSVLAVIAIYAFNRASGHKLGGIDGRRALYVVLVLAVGPGLIVNTALKDNFGRARPRDVAEFGGMKQFTPAFVMSRECNKNCSFSSGDAAGGFLAIALAFALRRGRSLMLAAFAFGAMISLARIAAGAHFFSDTVVSFFVVLIVADVLNYYVVLSHAERTATQVVAVGSRG